MNKLKRIREQAGLSQSQLAEKADIKLRTLQEYEQGRKSLEKAAVVAVLKITRVLNCKIEDLIDSETNLN
jgi:transcriptional regulator with XRE-family HTH domain